MEPLVILKHSNIAINILITMRPKQWIKNLFLFAPLVFSKSLLTFSLSMKTSIAFVAFCILSGCVYMINDVADREKDKKHPTKCLRPIASGMLSPTVALGMITIFLSLSLVGGYLVDIEFFAILVIYFLINLAYSTLLKHVVLLDVFVIAVGFVLRVIGGGAAIHVELSSWLLLCTLLIALFLALCKRRHELVLLEDDASSHREILGQYTPYFLDQLIAVVTASTVVSYALYTMSDNVYKNFGNNDLKYTIPFVIYGIFRYLYLVHRKDEGGNPTEMMMSDVPMLVNIGLWAFVVGIVLYR